MLIASKELQSSDNDDDEEVQQDEGDIDDRSDYERINDAKRHANKTFLHEHVLVSLLTRAH